MFAFDIKIMLFLSKYDFQKKKKQKSSNYTFICNKAWCLLKISLIFAL